MQPSTASLHRMRNASASLRNKVTYQSTDRQSNRPLNRSRVLQVRAKADVASSNGSLSSQQKGAGYSLPRGEQARADEWRTVYDFPQWIKHRKSTRLFDRLLQIPKSQILLNVLPSVSYTTGLAGLITLYMFLLDDKVLPSDFPSLQQNVAAVTFVNYTSVALSLLLVFRTNNGYGRWDEARKMWGLLINRTRDLIRQGCQTFPENDEESKKALGRWIIASVVSMRIHLQPDPGVTIESALGSILTPEELALLMKSSHRPVTAIAATGRVIQDQPISPYYHQLMYQNLTAFHDILGGCERILRAPIPVSFTRHTGRFLAVWLSVLPFSLYSTCGPWSIPLSTAVSAILCGIEEIGVQCEEPFGILPLEVICKRISTDVIATVDSDREIRTVVRSKPPVPEAVLTAA